MFKIELFPRYNNSAVIRAYSMPRWLSKVELLVSVYSRRLTLYSSLCYLGKLVQHNYMLWRSTGSFTSYTRSNGGITNELHNTSQGNIDEESSSMRNLININMYRNWWTYITRSSLLPNTYVDSRPRECSMGKLIHSDDFFSRNPNRRHTKRSYLQTSHTNDGSTLQNSSLRSLMYIKGVTHEIPGNIVLVFQQKLTSLKNLIHIKTILQDIFCVGLYQWG